VIPEAAVVVSFVAIVDRLISLADKREKSRESLLKNIIEPYFQELQVAYSSYLTTLRKTRRMLENGEAFPVVYSEVERLRAEDLVLRDKVREMAEKYETALSEADLKGFFGDARFLFGYWSGYHSSGTLRVMSALGDKNRAYSHKFVIESIDWVIDSAEDRWRELAKQYALIRAKYSQPITL
jgi:hypothetical protein